MLNNGTPCPEHKVGMMGSI